MKPGSRPAKKRLSLSISFQQFVSTLVRHGDRLSDLRLRLRHLDDGLTGLELTGIEKGSPLEKMGLQEGDVIREINGKTIQRSYKTAMMIDRLKSIPPSMFGPGALFHMGETWKKIGIDPATVPPEVQAIIEDGKKGRNIDLVVSRKI
jgi:membrane-associated protease RseP (regulator of RpoE activity)